ncbi:MAG: asparagine--tRNA ligase [Desulfobacterales bacterium]|nr:asparagine--tRNA ligase [Desulfobacterales bacterium]
MNRIHISDLLKSNDLLKNIQVKGWVRTCRESKEVTFIEINDGSCLKNIQAVTDKSLKNYNEVEKLTTGSSVAITGDLIESPGKGQKWEIQITGLEIIGLAPESYPLQKKRHTDEYLRTIAHLRPRTNKYGAIFRIRSELSYAIHSFFRNKGFKYIHTPIITASDCEGAGELFRVTTLDPKQFQNSGNKIDIYSLDFFGKQVNLTVSGQLEAEMFALALGNVYTFGPTFRAENSNTRRHAAEFWMVEPEMSFCDLKGNMDLSEETIKFLINFIIDNCEEDLELFSKYVDKNLMKTLESILSSDFIRLSYKDAIDILSECGDKFEYEIKHECDLQTEHERYLTEKHFKQPVIVYDFPKSIKPFYMRLNDDDTSVAAMDVLVPNIGEIIGGSQREERIDVLEKRMDEQNLPKEEYWWYLDSRRFGTAPHSGFGLGFERLLMLITGSSNIRDVIPFPRTPKNIDF